LAFLTFSCYRRRPYLGTRDAREVFVTAYVVMPEHVHLLVSEPRRVLLSKTIQALKLSVAVQRRERPFWQSRYYHFNIFSERKCLEKRRYIHPNPVTRGLVELPIEWPWSSFRHWWASDGRSRSSLTGQRCEGKAALNPMSQNQGHGAPDFVGGFGSVLISN
jgi:putative transposase